MIDKDMMMGKSKPYTRLLLLFLLAAVVFVAFSVLSSLVNDVILLWYLKLLFVCLLLSK